MFYQSFTPLERLINLEDSEVREAVKISQKVNSADRFTSYAKVLALRILQGWLKQEGFALEIESMESFLNGASTLGSSTINLRFLSLRFCLIPTFSFSDDPTDEIMDILETEETLSLHTADFFVVIAIENDLQVGGIKGCINRHSLSKIYNG